MKVKKKGIIRIIEDSKLAAYESKGFEKVVEPKADKKVEPKA